MVMNKSDDKKTGAVLVQGGGIAGVQAALDYQNPDDPVTHVLA